MVALSVNLKRVIIFIILALSIYLGYKTSGFSLRPQQETSVDTREAEQVFKNAINKDKTVMRFTVSDFNSAVNMYNEAINVEGVRQFYFTGRRRNIVSVIEIPIDLYSNVLSQLRQIPGLESEKTETEPVTTSSAIDIEKHIEQNNFLLQRYRERLGSPYITTREIGELHKQISNIQTKVDSLNQIRTILAEQEKDNQLIMTVIREVTAPPTSSNVKRFLKLLLYVAISFVLITICAMLVFFAIELLIKLMVVLGIVSKKSSSSLYHRYTHSGYGYNRRYDRSRIRKRIPRTQDEEQDDDKSVPQNDKVEK